MPKVLFLCTGNYYRSRFAEHLFNHLAPELCPEWEATSGALAIEWGTNNVGPMSPFTKAALLQIGVPLPSELRLPKQVTTRELETADHIVALKTAEHYPLLQQRYSVWAMRHLDRVEFWNIDDVEVLSPDLALAGIEKEVLELGRRLKGSPGSRSRNAQQRLVRRLANLWRKARGLISRDQSQRSANEGNGARGGMTLKK